MTSVDSVELRAATKDQLLEMMAWFPDRASCEDWGGPKFRFPFTEASFLKNAHWGKMASYSLIAEDGALLGFGQYYLRVGRCQLARLVIAPAHRGRGLGKVLIARLMEIGCADMGVDECSLFVMEHNEPAVRCYRGMGFETAEYPGDMMPIERCIFMVRRGASSEAFSQ